MDTSKFQKKDSQDLISRESSHLDSDFNHILKIQNGDMESFRTIVEKYKEKVRNLTYSIIGEKFLVDDIAQEVFTKVYLKINSFRFESKFSTWIYQITLNKCRDELRKKTFKSFFVLDETMSIKSKEDFHSSVESEDLSKIVRKEITRLPRKLREVVVLKDIEDLSYKEISTILNCNEGTVKSRLFRGRMQLRSRLMPFREELGL